MSSDILFFKLSAFKIPIKTTETSQQKYRLIRFFVQLRTPVPATSEATINAADSKESTSDPAAGTRTSEVATTRARP